jgi:hypothetical protein
MLCFEAEFVELKIYFIAVDAFSMDFVLLRFHSYEISFCCVGDITLLPLLLSCCKLCLTLLSHASVVIPSDYSSVASYDRHVWSIH